jgi:hypothetical protein
MLGKGGTINKRGYASIQQVGISLTTLKLFAVHYLDIDAEPHWKKRDMETDSPMKWPDVATVSLSQ